MSPASPQSDMEQQPLLASRSTLASHTKSSSVLAQLAVVFWVTAWMLFSSIIVIFNKWMFESGGFPYPLALTSLHMFACFLTFGSIRMLAPQQIRLSLMPDADVVVPWSIYLKKLMLISLLYAATLGAGNLAYLCSTVAFIQMLKPMNVIFASGFAMLFGMEARTMTHMIIVCVISFGVSVACFTAVQFSFRGACLQVFSTVCEGMRLVLMQSITTVGLRLDPVTTVYHFSFASSAALAIASRTLEPQLDLSQVNINMLALNCAISVCLNVLIATVIKKTSAVVFTLSGIVKDIGIIGASSVMFHSGVGILQTFGYSIAICGIFIFKVYKDNLEAFKDHGFVSGLSVTLAPSLRRMIK